MNDLIVEKPFEVLEVNFVTGIEAILIGAFFICIEIIVPCIMNMRFLKS